MKKFIIIFLALGVMIQLAKSCQRKKTRVPKYMEEQEQVLEESYSSPDIPAIQPDRSPIENKNLNQDKNNQPTPTPIHQPVDNYYNKPTDPVVESTPYPDNSQTNYNQQDYHQNQAEPYYQNNDRDNHYNQQNHVNEYGSGTTEAIHDPQFPSPAHQGHQEHYQNRQHQEPVPHYQEPDGHIPQMNAHGMPIGSEPPHEEHAQDINYAPAPPQPEPSYEPHYQQ